MLFERLQSLIGGRTVTDRAAIADGGEGGIDSKMLMHFLTPSGRAKARPNCGAICRTLSRVLTLLSPENKKPARSGLFIFGGEGGIRTLGTLPYTHFPGVLFRPLRHLTDEGANST